MGKKTQIIALITAMVLLSGCSMIDNIKDSFKKESTQEKVENKKSSNTKKKKTTNNTKYEITEEVTVKGEPFYVFQTSGESNDTVVLFARYNLNKEGKRQAPNKPSEETSVEFSSTEYWLEKAKNYNNWDNKKFDLNTTNGNGKGDAITKARDYAKSLGAEEGRLITYEEVEKMKIDYADMIGGHANIQDDSTDTKYLNYYTSSLRPFNIYKVYAVRGLREPTLEVDSALYGVRPIIVISKTLIDK